MPLPFITVAKKPVGPFCASPTATVDDQGLIVVFHDVAIAVNGVPGVMTSSRPYYVHALQAIA